MSEKSENKKPMKFSVKGNLKDLRAFTKLVSIRRKNFKKAPSTKTEPLYVNSLASRIHPNRQYLVIKEIIDETKSTKTFRCGPDEPKGTTELAYFRAGQYLSLKVDVNGCMITRPYSIASSPSDSLKGIYDITVKKMENGFLTDYIWDNWKVGDQIVSSAPFGFMYYEPIRDSRKIIGLAGGSGVTPFRSLAREICYGDLDAELNLIYGCSAEDDIIFYNEFKELSEKFPEKFKVTYVMSCEVVNMKDCESGFISSDIIQKYSDIKTDSYFICGPAIMYDFVEKELAKLNIPKKQIRMECYGEIKDVARFESYPKELIDASFKIKVHKNGQIQEIPALASETVLIALERAKLAPPSACRSGECQLCRSLLIKGDIWVSPKSDGRREADKMYGYFHPCASFPISDLEVQLPKTDER